MSIVVWEVLPADEACKAIAVPLPYTDRDAGLYVFPFLAPARVSLITYSDTAGVSRAGGVVMAPAVLLAASERFGGPAVELLFVGDAKIGERYGVCIPVDEASISPAAKLPALGFSAVQKEARKKDVVKRAEELLGKTMSRAVRSPWKTLYSKWWRPADATVILGGLARYLWGVIQGEREGRS